MDDFGVEHESSSEFESIIGDGDDSMRSSQSFLHSNTYEIKGKNGAMYMRHGAFCINSLNLPSDDLICVSDSIRSD